MLNELGVTDYCGEIYRDEKYCIGNILEKINKYVSFPEARKALASRANSIIDGCGCERIVNALLTI